MKLRNTSLLSVAISIAISFSASAEISWRTQQITNNSYPDYEPVLSDTDVAWLAQSDSSYYDDVHAYDGTSITQLTSTDELYEQNLFASEKYITWNLRDPANGDDVFLYDGTTVSQLTDSSTYDSSPRVFGERVAWSADSDIFLYDIASSTATALDPPVTSYDRNPWIHRDSVAFITNLGSRLYIYDIPGDTYDEAATGIANGPVINDDYVAYDYSSEVKVYVRATGMVRSIGSGNGAHLDDQHVMWVDETDDGPYGSALLYLYDASNAANTKQLIASNVTWEERNASIDGNLIVYTGYDGNDTEIFVYEIDSKTTTQLTDNDYYDLEPMVRGFKIVWTKDDVEDEQEIMMASVAPSIDEGDSISVTMDEDGVPTAFSLTLNATDLNNDILSWSISSNGSKGTAAATGTGVSMTINYTPNQDENGSDSFVVQVSDGQFTDTIMVNVTIEPVNDAPQFKSSTIEFTNGITLVGQVAVSDVDNDSATIIFQLIGGVDVNLFDLTTDGQLSFKKAPDIKNPDDDDRDNRYEITIRISDGDLSTEQAITIMPGGCTFFTLPTGNGEIAIICL